MPARAMDCMVRTSVPCSSPQLLTQRRLVHLILQGRSFDMLSDVVTSAFDAAPFNKHAANISEFALVLSLVPTAGVFDKCTNIIERCTRSQVNTCHTIPTACVFDKCTSIMERCSKNQVNTCHTVPTACVFDKRTSIIERCTRS